MFFYPCRMSLSMTAFSIADRTIYRSAQIHGQGPKGLRRAPIAPPTPALVLRVVHLHQRRRPWRRRPHRRRRSRAKPRQGACKRRRRLGWSLGNGLETLERVFAEGIDSAAEGETT